MSHGSFYDLGVAETVSQLRINLDNYGQINEIAFDIPHSDGYLYTVRVAKVQDNLFKGTATSQPDGEIAEVTCRLFNAEQSGTHMLFGSWWKYPGESNCPWCVMIEPE